MTRISNRLRMAGLILAVSGGLLWQSGPILAASATQSAVKSTHPFTTQANSGIGKLPQSPVIPKTAEDLKAIQNRVEAVAREALPATVGIVMSRGEGSGIIVSPDGYVLTAGHVSGTPGSRILIMLSNGDEYGAHAFGTNNGIDSGMIKIDNPPAGGFPFVPLGTTTNLVAGQWMVAIGHPGGIQPGRPPVVRLGKVLKEEGGNRAYIQTDCVLISGDSGGPVLDLDGRLVAINSRISSDTTENLHVPVDTFIDTWDRLARSEVWGADRRALGIAPAPKPISAGAAPSARLGVIPGESDKGVLINGITAGAPAEGTDLKIGDIITKVDDRLITAANDLAGIIAGHKPGDAVKLEYIRGSRRLQTFVKLGQRQDDPAARSRVDPTGQKSSLALLSTFSHVTSSSQSTVSVRALDQDANRTVALGTIVSSDGYILTKASEVMGPPKVWVLLNSGNTRRNYEAKIVGVSPEQDLAMLKIDATGLRPVTWGQTLAPRPGAIEARGEFRLPVAALQPAITSSDAVAVDVGQWVASVGPSADFGDQPIAVGVVSVMRRRIPRDDSVFLGWNLADAPNRGGARIQETFEDFAAPKSGFREGDIITAVNGRTARDRWDVLTSLDSMNAGDVAFFDVSRAGKTLSMKTAIEDAPTDSTMQMLIGGGISRRAGGFASVYQHDTIIRPDQCGGPIVDLQGRVLGINIARAGRTETYAIPADVIVPLIEPLKNGSLALPASTRTAR